MLVRQPWDLRLILILPIVISNVSDVKNGV